MKHFLIAIIFLGMVSSVFADGWYYAFIVDDATPHALVKNVKKKAVNQTVISKVIVKKGVTTYFLKVSEAVYNTGFGALTLAEVDALVVTAQDNTAEFDKIADKLIRAALLVLVDKMPGYTEAQFMIDLTAKYKSLP